MSTVEIADAEDPERAQRVSQRALAFQLLHDTGAGHLSLAAWCRIVRVIEREHATERAST